MWILLLNSRMNKLATAIYIRIKSLSVWLFMACASVYVYAQDDDRYINNFDLKPILLDSEDSESSTLGLAYLLDGQLLHRKFAGGDEGDSIDTDVLIDGLEISYSFKGIVTENSNNNPKNFHDSRVSLNYFRSSHSTLKVGAFIVAESDQEFDDRQWVYGLTLSFADTDLLAKNDILAAHINIGEVDPSKDTPRELVLGSNLDPYDRLDLELVYIYNIGTQNLDTFEINYRYFRELGAVSTIRQADLDTFKLVTYRLGFNNNLYIAYSAGELPFNQRDNQIYEVGFSYKFE